MATNINDLSKSWVADGTPDVTPVTESTPAVDAGSAAAVETPTLETSASTDTVVASSEAQADQSPPANDGAGVAAAAASPTAPGAAVVQAAVEAQIEYLEGKLGDSEFKIPKNVQVPWKRGAESGFAPLEEVLKSSMMERDYRIKTQGVAEEKRSVAAEKARITEEARIFAEEKKQFEEAFRDPEKRLAWEQHYEAMRSNPVYRKNVEDAREMRVTAAENSVYREEQEREVLSQTATQLADTIVELAAQYPGTDPERVRSIYADRLVAGAVQEITLDSIHQVYREEAEHSQKLLTPLKSELDTLRTELDALKRAQAAATHNAATDAAIANAKKAPVVVATGRAGGPPAPPAREAPTPFPSKELPNRIRSWVHSGSK